MKNVNEINKRSGAVWILTCLAIALAIGGSASSVLGQGSPPPLTANADGLIAGEAEDYDAIFEGSLGPHNWELFSDIEGFQGTGFMRAMPDGGASTGAAGDLTGEQGGVSPRMDYQVDFPAGGTWFVHLRGMTTNTSDDSSHVGINLVLDDLRTSWDGDDNAWYWTSIFANRTNEVRDRMTVTVPSAGVHTFNVWMREDGHRFDSFILTQDESFDPRPPPPLTANADGLIAGEAEDYVAIFEGSLGPHNWEFFTDIEGFQGTGFMRAMPDGLPGTANPEDLTGEDGGASPRMDYLVDFPAGGTWFVHLRAMNTSGNDDSSHVGVNLVLDGLRTRFESDDNVWIWTSIFQVRARITITVPSAGVHTFNVWMREDGHRFDSFILTQDESFDPNPALAPVLSITAGVGEVTVEWTSGQLQGADNVEGPYSDVAGTSPLTVPATGAARFYRAQ